jgi:hypothetical protein
MEGNLTESLHGAAIPILKIIAVNMKKRIEKRVFQSEKR